MDFFYCCEVIADEVYTCTKPLIGTKEGDRIVRIGADNTPTKVIDEVAETCILTILRKYKLCARVVSEEAGVVEMTGKEGTVFLDPIDGTFNALAGIPFYALSIAFARDGVIQKAFVRNLAHNETFTAEIGKGAFVNGTPIHVSETKELNHSSLCMYGRKSHYGQISTLFQDIRRSRQFGASALELCYVAAGRLDGFIDIRGSLRVTDAAAGVLICREAGGEVTDSNGNAILFPDAVSIESCLMATNSTLHRDIIAYFR